MITAGEETNSIAVLMQDRERLLEQFTRYVHHPAVPVDGRLGELRAYALDTPGKLLRPLLLVAACRAAGGDPERVFPAAAGTEYGHVASLVHDDIIDDDALRRGRQTVHLAFGVPAAILTGDLLIFETFLSYTQCADLGVAAADVLAAIRTLSTTCIEVCHGQALEQTSSGNLETDELGYLRIVRFKTASVCRAATRIGAQLSGAPSEVVDALGAYGEHLGIAFQIIDDVLAYDGHPDMVGKPLQSDLRNRRVTLPVIYALESGTPEVRQAVRTLFTAEGLDPAEAHRRLAALLHGCGALDRARDLAHYYTGKAKQQLDHLLPSEGRESLRALADVFISRDR
jgi:geranylgeranyl diphosphate synthase type I